MTGLMRMGVPNDQRVIGLLDRGYRNLQSFSALLVHGA